MDKIKVKTVSVSVLDSLSAEFQLDLQWIRAENAAERFAQIEEEDR